MNTTLSLMKSGIEPRSLLKFSMAISCLTLAALTYSPTAIAHSKSADDLALVPPGKTQTEQNDNWSSRIFHNWERPVNFSFLAGSYENGSTVRFTFKSVVCLDSVQISAFARHDNVHVFAAGVAKNHPEPLDQDIVISSITPPKQDPAYTFRVNRLVRQVSLLVGGGTLQINSARAIVRDAKLCPQY